MRSLGSVVDVRRTCNRVSGLVGIGEKSCALGTSDGSPNYVKSKQKSSKH